MGLSRRLFTKEFKLAAVRRLEQGTSIGEAARALEVNPNVLHRWRREFRTGPGNAFPGHGNPSQADLAHYQCLGSLRRVDLGLTRAGAPAPLGRRPAGGTRRYPAILGKERSC